MSWESLLFDTHGRFWKLKMFLEADEALPDVTTQVGLNRFSRPRLHQHKSHVALERSRQERRRKSKTTEIEIQKVYGVFQDVTSG